MPDHAIASSGDTSARASRTRTPARVPGGLPFVGHAFAFGRDPDGFIAACRARHGDVFRVRMPGGDRIFLLDPFDYPTVFAEDRLRFQESGAEIGGRVFGYPASKVLGPIWHEFSSLTGREMRGDALQALSEAMQVDFVRRISEEVTDSFVERPLLALLSEHFFAAGIEAIFGRGFYSRSLFEAYDTVDRRFAAAVAGIPPVLLPGLVRSRDELARRLLSPGPDHGNVLEARYAFYREHGIERELQGRLDLGLLWASQANTVATAFWTLYYLLRDEAAKNAVRDEVRSVVGEVGDPREAEPLSRDALRRLVLVDSATSEAMRLVTCPMNGRVVTEDFELPLATGESLPLKKGEEILLYPRVMHFDREIYEEPTSFRHDRFVDERGRARQFEKGGKRLTMPLLAFGGGMSMCPGRFFARNEIKVLVASMLAWLDTELVRTSEPPLDFSRVGLGMLPPKHDVRVRIRRRR